MMKRKQHKLWRAPLCPLLILALFLTGCGQAAAPASQPPASGTSQQPLSSAPLSTAPLQTNAGSSDTQEPVISPTEPSADEPEVASAPVASKAAAAESSQVEVPWDYDGKTGVLTFEGGGSLSSVEPENANELTFSWASLSDEVTSIVIGEGITRVPKCAFYGFRKVESVSLPSTLTSIGAYAFFQCNFQEIVIPNSVELIGVGAFSNCSRLRSCDIPKGVAVLDGSVFDECIALENVTLHEGLRELRDACLRGCDSLHTLTVPSTVTVLEDPLCPITVYIFLGDPPPVAKYTDWDGTEKYWLDQDWLTIYYPPENAAWQKLTSQFISDIICIEGIPEGS